MGNVIFFYLVWQIIGNSLFAGCYMSISFAQSFRTKRIIYHSYVAHFHETRHAYALYILLQQSLHLFQANTISTPWRAF